MNGPSGNLAALVEDLAWDRGWWPRPALVVGDRSFTHGQVHDGGARAASVLADMGVGLGDAVLLALADGAEFAWAFLGTARLGAVAVPVNPLLPPDDHRGLARDCRAAAIVCDDELVPRFGTASPVLSSSGLSGSLASADRLPAASVDSDDPAYAQYTSGTTGAPRAAVHRHADPPVYAKAFAERALALTSSDVILSLSKMYFAYGLGNSLFFPILTGAQAVLHPGRPQPREMADLAARHRSTVLFAVPTFYANLVREQPSPASFASLRVAVSAGERLTTALAARTARYLGCPVVDSLGSTEVGQAFVAGTVQAPGPPGTIGRALEPYEVSVRDDTGQDRGAGEVGMLWVRGPTVLIEYRGRPSETAAAFDGDWLCTGDLASIDEAGLVAHHGRADDMEMVGGITVAPQEIEELLSRHGSVSEVAVVALTDDAGASRLQAFVVPAPGAAVGDLLADELLSDARERLARYKVPRSVTFVDALPRTATGKLRRFVLRSGWARSDSLGVS